MSSNPPRVVDALIVHSVDPATPAPGGIATVIRGMCAYFPEGMTLAVVGVNTDPGTSHRVGTWERRENDRGLAYWFLPVTDSQGRRWMRRVPLSLRVFLGVLRHRRILPRARSLHAHRMDLAISVRALLRAPLSYFVHTQESGLVGPTSDSLWRFAGPLHGLLERHVVRRAASVVVFNRDHAEQLVRLNSKSMFLPTWYDPALLVTRTEGRDSHSVVWVGRVETPKDPLLAVEVFRRLAPMDDRWRLEMLGTGSRFAELEAAVAALPAPMRGRVLLRGRVEPREVYAVLARSGVFLMTSHPGYEGYPMVLVESMASGLPAVVTLGSDPGGVVRDGQTGFVTSRNPEDIAQRIVEASRLDREAASTAVRAHSAPVLVARAFAASSPVPVARGASNPEGPPKPVGA